MLYYLGIADLPGRKAHSIQEMRMCDAFVQAGEDVQYLHGHLIGEGGKITWDDVADHYGLEHEFEIKTFRHIHRTGKRLPKLRTLTMALPITGYVSAHILINRLTSNDVIYGRNYYPLYFLAELLQTLPETRRPNMYFEFHDPLDRRFENRFFKLMDGVVCITEALAEYTVDRYSVTREEILVAPDGVDLQPYEGISQAEARDQLGLPKDEEIIMYTGHLYEGKGVETLVETAKSLDCLVYVVGGYERDIERVQAVAGNPENVVFTGFVEPSEIPVYQIAADLLVAPYTEDSRPFISPLKLFEYMAAEKPIVASNRDVLQEVLNDGENALLFEAGDASSLNDAINKIRDTNVLANKLIEEAMRSAKQFAWENRAKTILQFITDD